MAAILSYSFAGARHLTKQSGALARRTGQFIRAIRNRRAAANLATLDDRMLADIGLTRSDLRDAYSEPIWQDPTDVLAGRAAERRVRRRRHATVQTNEEPPAWIGLESSTCR